MKIFTIAQQIDNLNLAERLWRERVTPADVVEDLGRWRCGTQACFGGHVMQWPEFEASGLRGYTVFPWWDEYLFDVRGFHPADPAPEDETISDWEIVINRIKHARTALENRMGQAEGE